MSTHTPGPWRRPTEIGTPWNVVDANGDDVALAMQRPEDMAHKLKEGPEASQPARTANATLIAAAPELRDALVALARRHDRAHEFGEGEAEPCECDEWQPIYQLLARLAKKPEARS